ncbi:dihydrodipicolinate synthase family protein [Lacrimispora indolis]|uniref:dihydrodipicolinate synthase family protein n=1 Tax=Lacrimispora indolis TaxID=69825 RepID=UPI0004240CBC|nr:MULTISPECIES: dihydrodipicolinate synthase family protein [Lachnospiraceae]MBE7720442.1 dihydrodipicolinate synthase family protein [Lacrimispora celerecrescens]
MEVSFYTPVVTAFNEHGELDLDGNKQIYDHLINGGIKGLLILGSSGEFYTMDMEQKKALIDMAVPYVNKRAKLFFGTACSTMEETLDLSDYALKAGADGVMLISPYYFTLDDASLENFYDEAAKNIAGPVYIYNFPDRTGYDVRPEIVLRLLRKHKNIVGLKDSVSEMGHTRALLTTVREEFPDFQVYCGFDENLIHNAACGGAGCIGGLSNVYPELMTQWQDAVNRNDWSLSFALQKKVDILMGIYDINPFFVPILKKAMMLRGVGIRDHCRKPVLPVTDEETRRLEEIMGKVDMMQQSGESDR